MAGNIPAPNPRRSPDHACGVIDRKRSNDGPHTLFQIVANKNSTDTQPPCINLIKLTEKLARDAKSGTLKGLGGFAEYDDGYMVGLEGSYLKNPESAVLPLKRLDRRIMDQIEDED